MSMMRNIKIQRAFDWNLSCAIDLGLNNVAYRHPLKTFFRGLLVPFGLSAAVPVIGFLKQKPYGRDSSDMSWRI